MTGMTDPEVERACAVAREGITLSVILFVMERIGATPRECQDFPRAWDGDQSYDLHAVWNTVIARYRSRRSS